MDASPATAIEEWDARWATDDGRADWLDPHPAIVALLPELKARGARQVLDLGWASAAMRSYWPSTALHDAVAAQQQLWPRPKSGPGYLCR
jgi:hypothetical protein